MKLKIEDHDRRNSAKMENAIPTHGPNAPPELQFTRGAQARAHGILPSKLGKDGMLRAAFNGLKGRMKGMSLLFNSHRLAFHPACVDSTQESERPAAMEDIWR